MIIFKEALVILFLIVLKTESRRLIRSGDLIVNRIFGGTNAPESKGKYVVRVTEYVAKNKKYFCGGSLIENDIVLTAGHCIHNDNVIKTTVRYGSHSFNGGNEIEINRKSIYRHKYYSNSTTANDIALIHLPRALTSSDNIETIPIARQTIEPGTRGDIYGWGVITRRGWRTAAYLQAAQATVTMNTLCNGVQWVAGHDSFICLYSILQTACNGDSGGPYVTTINGQKVLSGLTSFGINGCPRPALIFYTNVYKYARWIDEKIKEIRSKNDSSSPSSASSDSETAAGIGTIPIDGASINQTLPGLKSNSKFIPNLDNF